MWALFLAGEVGQKSLRPSGKREGYGASHMIVCMDDFEFLSPDSFRMMRTMEAAPEDVWDYLTRPELLEVWLASGTIEAKKGGRVELHFDLDESEERQKAGGAVYGVVRDIEPGCMLEYDWTDVAPGSSRASAQYPDSVVRFVLTPAGDGVEVEVVHGGLPTELLAGCATGWHVHLSILATVLAGEMPEPFEELFVAALPGFQAQLAESGIDV